MADDTNGAGDVFRTDLTTGTTVRVSVDSAGVQGNGVSASSTISADGRFISYVSYATNLVAGDTNGVGDVFLFDTATGVTTRVSVDSGGAEGNGNSFDPSISADGRYIAYSSDASNLVAGDTNGAGDIFLFDTTTSTTTLISVDSGGTHGNRDSDGPAISGNGLFITYFSYSNNLVAGDTNGMGDVFLFNTVTATTTLVSVSSSGTQGDGASYYPKISADGTAITYYSAATNLVTGDTNGMWDVFLYTTTTAETARVSVDSVGAQGDNLSFNPAISGDGSVVTYRSDATTLVPGDTNGVRDVFRFDTATAQTTRVSVDSAGAESNGASNDPSVSADGLRVAYESVASNLVAGDANGRGDIFLSDSSAPAAAAAPALAATGSDPRGAVALAALALGAGTLALLVHRRRHRAA